MSLDAIGGGQGPQAFNGGDKKTKVAVIVGDAQQVGEALKGMFGQMNGRSGEGGNDIGLG